MAQLWWSLAAVAFLAVLSTANGAAAPCFAGNYTEAKIGDNVRYNIMVNNTYIVATVVSRPTSGKVNWTNGTGSYNASNMEMFTMTFYYQNGWIDHEIAKPGPNCSYLVWNNTANWSRVNSFENQQVRHVFLVDSSGKTCSPDSDIRCASRHDMRTGSGGSNGLDSAQHIFLQDSHCTHSKLPTAFRWRNPRTDKDVTVLRESAHGMPTRLPEVHGKEGVVVFVGQQQKQSQAFTDDLNERYPSARTTSLSADEYGSRLMEWSDVLPRVDSAALNTEC